MNFSFNGKSNIEFNVILCENNHLDKPRKNIELVPIPGRSDPLIISDGTKENLQLDMTILIEDLENITLPVLIDRIEKWLLVDEYKDLIFDDGIKFKAVAITGLKIESYGVNSVMGNISFSCKDF